MYILLPVSESFRTHYEHDKLEDSLSRILYAQLIENSRHLIGKYEIELVNELLSAFKKSCEVELTDELKAKLNSIKEVKLCDLH